MGRNVLLVNGITVSRFIQVCVPTHSAGVQWAAINRQRFSPIFLLRLSTQLLLLTYIDMLIDLFVDRI